MYKHGLARIHASAILINSLFSGYDKRERALSVSFKPTIQIPTAFKKLHPYLTHFPTPPLSPKKDAI
ncbi:hypothetical protein CWC21_01160 [Pseudoalteromonas phenolica]|nr:hypothetical protein CWC21_01160 [Pseudoalteromonas phenolica]